MEAEKQHGQSTGETRGNTCTHTPLGALPLTPILVCRSPASRTEALERVPEAGAFSQGDTFCPWTAHQPPACLPDGSCWATRPVVLSIQSAKVKMKCVGGKRCRVVKELFKIIHLASVVARNNVLVHGHIYMNMVHFLPGMCKSLFSGW